MISNLIKMKNKKVPHCRNSFKIQAKNPRDGEKIDSIHIYFWNW